MCKFQSFPLPGQISIFPHLCLFLFHRSLELAGAAWITGSQRHSSQSPPGKCGELSRARAGPADVTRRKPMKPLRTKGVVVSREDLVNLIISKRKTR